MDHLALTRNFCIIAHIDHGKSTLADRMLLLTKTIEQRVFRDQMLDAMDLERERGITIKSHPVSMRYLAVDGVAYAFNLIDTPGHVDFTYEVSRSMAACEGALLVVDATQGVEAQTVANSYLAIERNLEIIPVINKVDMPNANVAEVRKQIEDVLGIEADQAMLVSAKTGLGVGELMEAIIRRIPAPRPLGNPDQTRALIFDSMFDAFRGVVTYVRVVDGVLRVGDPVRLLAKNKESEIKEVGVFHPKPTPVSELRMGQVGYFISSFKEPADVLIGDTVSVPVRGRESRVALPGFREVRPMVFSGIYPVDSADYEKFKDSLMKLTMNDSALTHHPETSVALGFGFRCGFLGLLHMEITQERLRREFDVDIINTHPGVVYRITMRNGEVIEVDNPLRLPDVTRIETIEEPLVRATIICHNEHIGDIMKLVMDRRGEVTRTDSLDVRRVMLTATLPLNEILVEFHDSLKSISSGYASMDYEFAGYRPSDIVKMDILLNNDPVDAFACLVHRDKAEGRGRQMCKVLKDVIPPHMFTVPVQAALGKTIIARETIRAFRKDVTAKLYGGDVTRKQKLLKKQKEGKKRMKQYGSVNVPQRAFVAVLKSS